MVDSKINAPFLITKIYRQIQKEMGNHCPPLAPLQILDLNENNPHRLLYVNAWSPVGGTF